VPKTLYGIEVNETLIWDYDWCVEEYETERFFRWYLGRLLSSGTAKDVKTVPYVIISEYLDDLRLPGNVRAFWAGYFGRRRRFGNTYTSSEKAS
jgi:hypothetical protein